MFRFRKVILCLSLLLTLKLGMAQQSPEVSCGVRSVLSLAALQNRSVTAEQREQLIKAYPEATISLAAVKTITQSLGFDVAGVKATLSELVALQRPAIIHLTQPDHFVLMVDGNAENIRLLERPEAKISVVARAEIEKRFDGYALILPPAPADAPRIQFERTDVAFENVGAAEKIERDFKFTNIGWQALVVVVSGSTCGCTSALIAGIGDNKTNQANEIRLKRGESSVVKMTYSVHGGGAIEEATTLRTNDPLRPVIHLTLRGMAPQNLQLSPAALFFNAEKGAKGQREITLVGPVDMNIIEVKIDTPRFDVKAEPIKQDEVKKTWRVVVSYDGNGNVGQTPASLEIKSNYAPRPVITIPVTTLVRSDLQITPPTAFVGFLKKGETKRLEVTIQSQSGKAFRLWNPVLPPAMKDVNVSIDNDKPAAKHFVTIECHSEQAQFLEANLLLTSDVPGEESIAVPITALIQE